MYTVKLLIIVIIVLLLILKWDVGGGESWVVDSIEFCLIHFSEIISIKSCLFNLALSPPEY